MILLESPISWVHKKMKEEQELFGVRWSAYEREKPAPCIILFLTVGYELHRWSPIRLSSNFAHFLYHLTSAMFPFHLRERGKFPHGPSDLVFIVEKSLSVETSYFLQEGAVCKFNLYELWKKPSFRTITKINDFLCLHFFFRDTVSSWLGIHHIDQTFLKLTGLSQPPESWD